MWTLGFIALRASRYSSEVLIFRCLHPPKDSKYLLLSVPFKRISVQQVLFKRGWIGLARPPKAYGGWKKVKSSVPRSFREWL